MDISGSTTPHGKALYFLFLAFFLHYFLLFWQLFTAVNFSSLFILP